MCLTTLAACCSESILSIRKKRRHKQITIPFPTCHCFYYPNSLKLCNVLVFWQKKCLYTNEMLNLVHVVQVEQGDKSLLAITIFSTVIIEISIYIILYYIYYIIVISFVYDLYVLNKSTKRMHCTGLLFSLL